MKNKIIILLLAILTAQVSFGQVKTYKGRMFPYYIDFENTSKSSRITESIGSGAPTGSKRYTDEGILLTDDTKNTISGFYFNDLIIKKNYIFEFEFEYAAFGGTPANGEYGEGLTMFLFDKDANFNLGSGGTGLGYVYNNGSTKQAGLSGAYLGIGFDNSGDFKLRGTSSSTKREGVYNVPFKHDSSFITFRGGQHKNDRYKGYPVLYSRSTDGWMNKSDVIEAKLNSTTGDYETDYASGVGNVRTDYGQYIRYNGIRMSVYQEDSGNEGWSISASLRDFGDLYYTIGSIRIRNNTKARDENGSVYNFESLAPEAMRLGFTATTGQATQKHMIRGFGVQLNYTPETIDKVITLCLAENDNTEGVTLKDPFKGAVFYTGTWGDMAQGDTFRHIDLDSILLEDEEGRPVDYVREDYDYGNFSLIYDEPGVGEWDFYRGQSNATLFFTPENKKMKEGEYSIYISAKSEDTGKGGPFSDEAYRSRPTKITVKAKYCKSVVNPSLPIRVKVEPEDD